MTHRTGVSSTCPERAILVVTQQVGIAGGIFSSCFIFKPNKKAGVPRERFFIKILKMRRIQVTDEAAEM